MKTGRVPTSSRADGGFLLLEVLVALMIFAIGVLSIVGLQVASVKQSSAAKFRADASLLANDLIGRMWIGDRDFTDLEAQYATGNPAYLDWRATVEATLPGAADNPPTVAVESVAGGVPAGGAVVTPSSLVTIVLRWKAPNEPDDDPVHNVTVVTQIK